MTVEHINSLPTESNYPDGFVSKLAHLYGGMPIAHLKAPRPFIYAPRTLAALNGLLLYRD